MSITVLNTRPNNSLKELTLKLEAHGLRVFESPMLSIDFDTAKVALTNLSLRFKKSDWLVLTSANGARSLANIEAYKSQISIPKTAVIGDKTAKVAHELGFKVAFVSSSPNSVSFSNEFLSFLDTQKTPSSIYLFRADTATDELPDALKASKYNVYSHVAYHNKAIKMTELEIRQLSDRLGLSAVSSLHTKVDILTVTSSSALNNLVESLYSKKHHWSKDLVIRLQNIPLCVIGPKTMKTALEHGFKKVIKAKDANINSLVDAVLYYIVSTNENYQIIGNANSYLSNTDKHICPSGNNEEIDQALSTCSGAKSLSHKKYNSITI